MYYNPIKQNVNVFEKKGDIVATANIQPLFAQLGIEAAYAINDNIGISSNYNRYNITRLGGETNPFVKDFMWDNELIFYKNFKFGLFGAANFGYGRGGFNVGNPYFRLSMDRLYSQPSVGFLLFNRFGFAFSTRFSQSFYHIKIYPEGYSDSEIKLIQSYFGLNNIDKPVFFIEPAFTLIWKDNTGSCKLQFVHSKSNRFNYGFNTENIILSIGININYFLNRGKYMH